LRVSERESSPAKREEQVISESGDTAAAVESTRVAALRRYVVVDSAANRVASRVAALAARILSAPIGTVSLVDEDRIWLAGTHGLDAGIREIARSEGLCEEVITGTASHLVITDTHTTTRYATDTFLRDNAIRFCACVPIVTHDGYRIGSVAALDTAPGMADAAQVAMLADLAAIVMEQLELRVSSRDALRAEQTHRQSAEADRDGARVARDAARVARDAARVDRDNAQQGRRDAVRDRDIAERGRDLVEEYASVLQQTLLPPSLPTIDGLSVASYYHPADPRQVGGDFYDLFGLGDDRWAFFIGDVQGHGARAAVATSLIRYTLRSAVLHHPDPIDALAELNAVLLREADPAGFCTVLLGMLRPGDDGDGFAMTIATGGHEPALLIDPSTGTVTQVRSAKGMLVGATSRAVFDSCTTQLRSGQTILFYTDGLIEARRGASPFDESALIGFTRDRAHLPAARLVEEFTTLIPKLDPEDDVALLAVTAT
jgi:phosphoserine phosphatase RsbU/P